MSRRYDNKHANHVYTSTSYIHWTTRKHCLMIYAGNASFLFLLIPNARNSRGVICKKVRKYGRKYAHSHKNVYLYVYVLYKKLNGYDVNLLCIRMHILRYWIINYPDSTEESSKRIFFIPDLQNRFMFHLIHVLEVCISESPKRFRFYAANCEFSLLFQIQKIFFFFFYFFILWKSKLYFVFIQTKYHFC